MHQAGNFAEEVVWKKGFLQERGASVVDLFGYRFAVLSLDGLISSKRAAGRQKDLLALPELEALREATQDLPADVPPSLQ